VRWALAALLLVGCAEMRRPPSAPPPADLSGGVMVDPLPGIIRLAAADFDRQGAGLAGRPTATALAAARLEWLAGETDPQGRLAGMPQSYRFGLQRGVDELRASLAIRPEATPSQTVPALLAAARRLAAGETPELGEAVFRETRPTALERLAEPGPQPNAAIATEALREEYARQAAERRTDPRAQMDSPGMGLTTFGLGGNTDR
jgi:hypothetical protein